MNKRMDIKAQVIIETTIALLVLLMILVGSTKVFLYLSGDMANRNTAFERTRNIIHNPAVPGGISPDDVQNFTYSSSSKIDIVP